MAIIENEIFRFSNDVKSGCFNVNLNGANPISFVNNKLAITGQLSSGEHFDIDLLLRHSVVPTTHLSPDSVSLRFESAESEVGLFWVVDVALSDDGNLLKWRINVGNENPNPISIEKIYVLNPVVENHPNLKFNTSKNIDLRFFSNGWQSWSYTGATASDDRMRRSRLGFLQDPMVLNTGTPVFKKKGEFSSDLFAIVGDQKTGSGFVAGFLSQTHQFGSVTAKLNNYQILHAWANCDHVCLEPGKEISTDWFVIGTCDLHDSSSIDPYLDAVASAHAISKLHEPPVGWCSWYYYYQNISESKIASNIEVIDRIKESTPIKLIQIDDGFEQQVGDWLEFNEKFPNGFTNLVEKIKKKGCIAGVWLAPFIVHPRSRLAKEHQEWLLRRRDGKCTRAGFVWNSLGYALDLTVPAALEYVRLVIKTAVEEWGFQYLKLDFLYAAALDCEYADNTKTRAQVLRAGMLAVREAAGDDVTLLGCGAPLGSMLGIVDIMRIGADVGGHWKPDFFNLGFLFNREPHMPSAENSIHNIITRAWSHNKWWVNDPDCLLVREVSGLTLDEVQTLASVITMTGGSVLLSDDMQQLAADRLRIAQAIIPPINQRARVMDWMNPGTPVRMRLDLNGVVGEWNLISYSNWQDVTVTVSLSAEDYGIENADYFVNSFWKEKSWYAENGQPLFEGNVSPHQTILLAIRKKKLNPQFIASSLHVSQGLEIKQFEQKKKTLNILFGHNKRLNGYVELELENDPKTVKLDGQETRWKTTDLGTYRFFFHDCPPGSLVISY